MPPAGARRLSSIPASKPAQLTLLAVAELLAMGLWFSATVVVPDLAAAWQLDAGAQAWLTMSVQLGFVVGALAAAAVNLPDRWSPHRLIATGTLLGAACTALIATAAHGLPATLLLRFLTGACLALVYPPGMKLVATWCHRDRGLGIGLLVGALTVGSAGPHLLQAFPHLAAVDGVPGWRILLGGAAGLAALGGALAWSFVRPGPLLVRPVRFHWRHALEGLRHPGVRLANFGYFGHMWELYAMWAWAPIVLKASYARAGLDAGLGHLAGFGIVAVGGIGSVLAGLWADRWGRTATTITSLVVSGSCALVAGVWLDAPALLTALYLVWGFAVVADSAQFSTAVSELADPRWVGTALTVQTSLGFLLTLVTLRVVPAAASAWGWQWAFVVLVPGPLFGVTSMLRLRRRPEAVRMAGGQR